MYKAIEEARQTGHSDDDILSFVMSRSPELESRSKQALDSGYDSSQILDFISATTKEGKFPTDISTDTELPKSERGFISGTKRGFKRGITGLVSGAEEQLPREEGFFEHLGVLAGETISDIPAMAVGGIAGGFAGAAVGGPVGGVFGSRAGALAVPSIIKQAFEEYREHARKGSGLTFACS